MTVSTDDDIRTEPGAAVTTRIASTQDVRSTLARLQRRPFLDGALRPPATDAGQPIPNDELLEKALLALSLTGNERVLEIGSSTGYETALLSRLAGEVLSLTPDEECAAARTSLLQSTGCDNVKVVVGPSQDGWAGAAPYPAIFVACGASEIPPALFDQLQLNGRLVIPLGDATGQLLELVQRRHDGFVTETLASCHLAMLPWASRRPSSFPWHREG